MGATRTLSSFWHHSSTSRPARLCMSTSLSFNACAVSGSILAMMSRLVFLVACFFTSSKDTKVLVQFCRDAGPCVSSAYLAKKAYTA